MPAQQLPVYADPFSFNFDIEFLVLLRLTNYHLFSGLLPENVGLISEKEFG
jgi:hypothetical protein